MTELFSDEWQRMVTAKYGEAESSNGIVQRSSAQLSNGTVMPRQAAALVRIATLSDGRAGHGMVGAK